MIESRFPYAYRSVHKELRRRLLEPAPSRVQVLSGPRQVGKTHLLRELEMGLRGRAVYREADAPAASLSGWWETLWQEAERLARTRSGAVLFIDEIQHLPDWGRRLKSQYDRITHEKTPLHVVVSGSSSLRLGQGTKETMAGRFEHLRLLHWPVVELVRCFHLPSQEATELAAGFGTYPGTVSLFSDTVRWSSYVRDSIIEPAIGRDIMALEIIRKPALLRQLFMLAASHPAEVVSLQKLQGRLTDRGALETLAHYLHVLEDACLVAAIEKYSTSAIRRRSSPPKLVVLNQAILGALADQGPQKAMADSSTRGRWIENACLATAWNAGQNVFYWRQEPLEVDIVLNGSWGSWAIEVETGSFTERELAGLLKFCATHSDFRPLVVCDHGNEGVARRIGIGACTWQRFLQNGPPP